jgi:hypothetical protein
MVFRRLSPRRDLLWAYLYKADTLAMFPASYDQFYISFEIFPGRNARDRCQESDSVQRSLCADRGIPHSQSKPPPLNSRPHLSVTKGALSPFAATAISHVPFVPHPRSNRYTAHKRPASSVHRAAALFKRPPPSAPFHRPRLHPCSRPHAPETAFCACSMRSRPLRPRHAYPPSTRPREARAADPNRKRRV